MDQNRAFERKREREREEKKKKKKKGKKGKKEERKDKPALSSFRGLQKRPMTFHQAGPTIKKTVM